MRSHWNVYEEAEPIPNGFTTASYFAETSQTRARRCIASSSINIGER